METYMRIATMFVLMLLPVFSFGEGLAGPSEKMDLPKELQGSIVPGFFALAIDNETEFNRDNLAEEAKKQKAKRIVLSFFATWCVYCQSELVQLKESAGALKAKGVQVYLIDVGEKIMQKGKAVSDFVGEYAGNAFPFYFDQNAKMLKSFGILKSDAVEVGLPRIVVMDANLKVLNVFTAAGNDFPQVLWENL